MKLGTSATLAHNGYSTSDDQSGRHGDFEIEDVVVHVTTAPTEALIAKCQKNLGDGRRPVIVTLDKGVAVAETLAETVGVVGRLDIFEIEQFVATAEPAVK